jgi:hypothetical protein
MQPIPQDYGRLLGEIKERIRSAQYEALRKVNRELISLYWDIGRLIVERQREAGWGKSVVETLAEDLQAEFPGIKGFSAANLWRMRLFYDTYACNEKLAPMMREILFADDAAQSFSFMDTCRKRCDMVLVNPSWSKPSPTFWRKPSEHAPDLFQY